MIERRHTNRRDFFDEDVPPDVIYELTTAAEHEETVAAAHLDPEHRIIAAQLSQEAEAIQSPTRSIARSLRHGRLQTCIEPTVFRSMQFRILMPIPSLRLWFVTSTLPERDGCRG